ncbi:DUF5518 domain-containing protein [Haloterrigena salinisoli]|uniref:DUF5518 domain-containing protein n=1 Tax=Haloterrigena salinisoli TaxID=3132747 RepID=UPI0030CF54D9
MTLDRRFRSLLANERWRYAIVGGLVAVPLTTLSYWQTGSEIGLWPIGLGGLLAGYWFEGSAAERTRVGVRAGLVGALPTAWLLVDLLWFIHVELRGSAPSRLLQSAVAVVGVAGIIALAALAGTIGARIGGWLRGKLDRDGPSVAAG